MLQSNHNKNARQILTKKNSKNIYLLKTVNITKNKERVRNCHRQEGPKEA